MTDLLLSTSSIWFDLRIIYIRHRKYKVHEEEREKQYTTLVNILWCFDWKQDDLQLIDNM